jgi:manganese-dependent inorganic pyrophosphatase
VIIRNTPTEYFAKVVHGQVIYDDPHRKLNGMIGILTRNYEERLIDCDARGRIIISGNEKHAMLELIRQGAGMLVLLKSAEVDEEVLALAKEHHCPIVRSGCGAMNTSRYLYLAPPVSFIMRDKVVSFRTNEIADDVGKKLSASRFRSYPVVDEENHLVGYITRYHMMNYHNKRMILVDHNQFQQSVSGIVDAPVLEVIDHHRVADFSTHKPVDFRNEIVGATSTIIATIFRENMVPFTRELAGLLLGGILSETVNLQTPSTSARDIETANILAAIADLKLDEFARELFSLDTEVRDKMVNEMISHDMIFRDIAGIRAVFGRVNVSDIESYRQDTLDIRSRIHDYCDAREMDLCVLAFVSALENGCILYCGGKKADWVLEAFPDREGEENSFHEGIVSRTSQIIPRVTEVIEKYML